MTNFALLNTPHQSCVVWYFIIGIVCFGAGVLLTLVYRGESNNQRLSATYIVFEEVQKLYQQVLDTNDPQEATEALRKIVTTPSVSSALPKFREACQATSRKIRQGDFGDFLEAREKLRHKFPSVI